MNKNVLAGRHKQFEHCQHTKMHLSGVKAQYWAKMVLFPDGMSFPSFLFPSFRTMINNTNQYVGGKFTQCFSEYYGSMCFEIKHAKLILMPSPNYYQKRGVDSDL